VLRYYVKEHHMIQIINTKSSNYVKYMYENLINISFFCSLLAKMKMG